MNVLPIFLNNLAGRRCLVFGFTHETERKVEDLLGCDASVTLVAPRVSDRLEAWARDGRITWHAREYRPGDLKDSVLAILSETNPQKSAPIWKEAQEEKVLINAMDDVAHCTFVSGSVVRRGPLVISISTSGCAPALAVRIRERLERMFGDVYGTFAGLLGSLRGAMQARYPGFDERRARWYEIVDSDVLPLLEEGRREEAMQLLESLAGFDLARTEGSYPKTAENGHRNEPAYGSGS